jgi:Skp family chaperone for outer membrane proteins
VRAPTKRELEAEIRRQDAELTRLRAELAAEKETRVRYQGAVYAVCTWIDSRLRSGITGAHQDEVMARLNAVWGKFHAANTLAASLQSELAAEKERREKAESERNEMIAQRDAAAEDALRLERERNAARRVLRKCRKIMSDAATVIGEYPDVSNPSRTLALVLALNSGIAAIDAIQEGRDAD